MGVDSALDTSLLSRNHNDTCSIKSLYGLWTAFSRNHSFGSFVYNLPGSLNTSAASQGIILVINYFQIIVIRIDN
jgi:hypothetical protein